MDTAARNLLFLALLWAGCWSRWPLGCPTASVCTRFCCCCCWTIGHAQACGFSINVSVTLGGSVILLLICPLILSSGLWCSLREAIIPLSHCCILSRENCRVALKKRIAKRLLSMIAVFQIFFFCLLDFSVKSCDTLFKFSAVKFRKVSEFFAF